MLKELILERLVSRIVAGSIKQRSILSIVLRHSLHLFVIISTGQCRQTIRVHLAATRIQLGAIVLRQFSAKRIDRDDDRTSIGLEGQDLAHHIGSGASQSLAELVERLQVRLVQRIPDDLDVHLVQILLRNTVHEERSQRCVDEHSVVQLSRIGRHMDGLHLLEAAQRMALGDQLGDGTLVQRSGDQQNDVVDHVAVGDEIQEGGQRLDGMVAHVLEFDDQLLAQFVVDYRHGQR